MNNYLVGSVAILVVGLMWAQGRHSDRAAAWWLGVQHVDQEVGFTPSAKSCLESKWNKQRSDLGRTQQQAYTQGYATAQGCARLADAGR